MSSDNTTPYNLKKYPKLYTIYYGIRSYFTQLSMSTNPSQILLVQPVCNMVTNTSGNISGADSHDLIILMGL
jgi:hypothetical protein